MYKSRLLLLIEIKTKSARLNSTVQYIHLSCAYVRSAVDQHDSLSGMIVPTMVRGHLKSYKKKDLTSAVQS